MVRSGCKRFSRRSRAGSAPSSPPPGGLADVAFRGPVRAGDTITCTAAPPEAHAGDVLVRAVCRNQDGGLVLEALVVVPRQLAPRVH